MSVSDPHPPGAAGVEPSGGFRASGMPAVLAVLFLLSLAVLPLVSRWRGDESFYTDAVVRMFETGDFLTPRTADGQPRYQKPILNYWAVAACHRLAGGGYLGVRLPFLLAGAATLAMAWLIALRLFRSRATAWAAVGILLGSGQVIKLSARATPDMLQCAFFALSMLGLSGMLFERRFTWPNRLAFWAGAGLVAATKGGLALLLILFAFAFVRRRGGGLGVRARQLLHAPSMLLALAVAAGWFVAVIVRDGDAAWAGFWHDQVGGRFEGSKTYLLTNAATYLTAWIPDLLPWSVVLLYMAWRDRASLRAAFGEHREAAWFVLAWHALLLVVFTLGNMTRARYFLPAYVLDAGLLAAVLLGWIARRPSGARAVDVAAAIAAGVVAAAGLRHVPLALRGVWPEATWSLLAWAALAPALAWAAWTWMRRSPPAGRILLTGCLWMAASRLDDLFVRRTLYPPAAPAVAEFLLARPSGPPTRVAAIGLRDGNESQLRLLLAGRTRVDRVAVTNATSRGLAGYDAVVVEERHRPAFRTSAWWFESAGTGYQEWSPADFLKLAAGRDRDPVMARRRERLYVGLPTGAASGTE